MTCQTTFNEKTALFYNIPGISIGSYEPKRKGWNPNGMLKKLELKMCKYEVLRIFCRESHIPRGAGLQTEETRSFASRVPEWDTRKHIHIGFLKCLVKFKGFGL